MTRVILYNFSEGKKNNMKFEEKNLEKGRFTEKTGYIFIKNKFLEISSSKNPIFEGINLF
jgi:hypothetical protein